jgi:uncharacterized protein (DUF1499 family)
MREFKTQCFSVNSDSIIINSKNIVIINKDEFLKALLTDKQYKFLKDVNDFDTEKNNSVLKYKDEKYKLD